MEILSGSNTLKKELLSLVEGCHQVEYQSKDWRNQKHYINRYSIDEDGNLISLVYGDKREINWSLLQSCTNLYQLTLSRFELTFIPAELFNILSLEILDLSSNKLTRLPEEIGQLKKLKGLNISSNLFDTYPNEIKYLLNLNSLNLSHNLLKELPNTALFLKNLSTLNISFNELSELPTNIGQLNKLTNLNISANKFNIYPKAINSLINLKDLNLSSNFLNELPDDIGLLKNLTFLIASNNTISKLPEALFELNKLTFLLLSMNNISEIPDSIQKLEKLHYFHIDGNQLTRIPKGFEKLNIHRISLNSNSLPIPDLSFHELTASEQVETMLSIQDSELYPLKQAKILVVGDERVGKTSVINRLLGKPHNENQTSTQGIDISDLGFSDFQTNIWDFAGQELTHQTHQFFLTERSLYIYVLDAQKEDNQSRDLHWFNTIKSYSANSPIIVVINHSDQNINYQFDIQRYQEDFQIVDIIYTSACNLNSLTEAVKVKLGDSIDKLNQSIHDQLPNLPGIERKLPKSWHQVKEAMENYKLNLNVIEKDLYEKECEKVGVIGKPLQTALLKILNSIGTVIAYPNDFRLKLTQILKPEWVTNAVYKIIRSPVTTPGIYSENVIEKILDETYTSNQQQWLVDLLIKFELGFRLSNSSDILIPMRLPSVMPDFNKQQYQKGLNIRFNYHRIGLLKLNVLPQLIVRMNTYVNEQTTKYWRHGLFLKYNDCQGVIISDEPNQCIDVYLSTRNENARTLLQWIRENLKKIEESQIKSSKDNQSPYKEEIAIFDTSNSDILGYVNYDRVERAYTKGRNTISVEVKYPKTGEIDDVDVDVSNLLGLYRGTTNTYDEKGLTQILISILLRLTEVKAKVINEQEDDINDRLRESLISSGYTITDQSRGGFSGSGNGVGERDLIILNEYGQQATLIEAMCLTSAVKDKIVSHHEKLSNHYNTQGNPFDFLITYAKVKNFENFWKSYKSNFDGITDQTRQYTDKSVIKVGYTTIKIEDSEQARKILHLIVNFGVSPSS